MQPLPQNFANEVMLEPRTANSDIPEPVHSVTFFKNLQEEIQQFGEATAHMQSPHVLSQSG